MSSELLTYTHLYCRWRWAALAQGAAAFPHDFPDAPAAAAEADRAAAAAAAARAARPPGKRPPSAPGPLLWHSLTRALTCERPPADELASEDAQPALGRPLAHPMQVSADQGIPAAPGGTAGSPLSAGAVEMACAMEVDGAACDTERASGPAASKPAQAAQSGTAPANEGGEQCMSAKRPVDLPAEQGAAAAPCDDQHATGLLPDEYYVARNPATLAHVLAPDGAWSASSSLPALRWGRPCVRPAGAFAWRAPTPSCQAGGPQSGPGLEPSSASARCLVRVMLHVIGRGVAREGAAVHICRADPGLSPGLGLETAIRQRKHHRSARQVLHAADAAAVGPVTACRLPEALSQQTGVDPAASLSLGPIVGHVTSEAPRGSPVNRGAVAVCQAAPLLAARGRWGAGAQGYGHGRKTCMQSARVLVANPRGGTIVCANAVLWLEMRGTDEAAW